MAGHGGIAPEIGNPVFQKAASDEFIVTTIRNGRRNTAMASFQPKAPGTAGLSDSQLGDLLAFLRTFGVTSPGQLSANSATSASQTEKQAEAPR